MSPRIKSWNPERLTNAQLIAEVVPVFVPPGVTVYDPTYGFGNFYTEWRPRRLIGTDIVPERNPNSAIANSVDFRNTPFRARHFRAIIFDPPYKMNGRPDPVVDARYGVDKPMRWQDRWQMCLDGAVEMERILAYDGYLFIKIKNQVVSRKFLWQEGIMVQQMTALGLVYKGTAYFHSHREQPPKKTQEHLDNNLSQLLIFYKPAPKKRKK